jgi:hypothetical protein
MVAFIEKSAKHSQVIVFEIGIYEQFVTIHDE